MSSLCQDDVSRLLQLFAAAQFRPKDCSKEAVVVQETVCHLFRRNQPDTVFIQNTSGELSTSYPLTIIVPRDTSVKKEPATSDACTGLNPIANGDVDAGKIRDLMLKARVARCRARFPVPVILWDGKYVCRSATLSGGPEIYGRSGFDLLFPSANEEGQQSPDPVSEPLVDQTPAACDSTQSLPSFSSLSLGDSSQIFSKVRAQDINLLHQLGVRYICDLMVEKKKVKFGVYITSSEKADKEGRYSNFRILSLPYPGCEFFRVYWDKCYVTEGLVFDWSQNFVDAVLDIPSDDEIAASLKEIRWKDYRKWDIIQLTQNYLRLFLRYLICSDSSLLIHCISGWDRTPLFVSLMRLTLWADGKIHTDLTPLEILYLTLAYDWYLFGHNLTDRLQKGEEILFFCFYSFLPFLAADEFSVEAIQKQWQGLNGRNMHRCSKESLSDGILDPADEVGSSSSDRNSSCHLGSCTSLTSNSSSASLRSQEPPAFFNCPETSFYCVGNESSYPNTPPTLTNSEEGPLFLADAVSDTVDFAPSPSGSRLTEKSDDNRAVPSQTTPVPIPSNCERRESASKFDESWQFVSETGSIKDSPRCLPFNSPDSHDSNCSSGHVKRNGLQTNGGDCSPRSLHSRSERESGRQLRKERLKHVRTIFYQAYTAEIGHRQKNGTETKTMTTGLSLLYQHFGVGGTNGSRVTAHH